MKRTIIVHGMPSKEEYLNKSVDSPSNCHWLPWLQKQLLVNNILAQTPEFPEPYHPVYEEWKKVFEQMGIDKETHLVGHSAGAGFLLRWLSETETSVGKVALIAPWIDLDDELGNKNFECILDEFLLKKTTQLTVFVSNDDDEQIIRSVTEIQKNIPSIEIKNFTGKGHFTLSDMGTREFPELTEFLISNNINS